MKTLPPEAQVTSEASDRQTDLLGGGYPQAHVLSKHQGSKVQHKLARLGAGQSLRPGEMGEGKAIQAERWRPCLGSWARNLTMNSSCASNWTWSHSKALGLNSVSPQPPPKIQVYVELQSVALFGNSVLQMKSVKFPGKKLCSWRWRRPIQPAKTRLGADRGSDHKLLIAKFRLELKVGKTIRPFQYDLNQIPCNYTVEVTNRFKGWDLIDRVSEELWTEVYNTLWEAVNKTPSPRKIDAKRQNGYLRRL